MIKLHILNSALKFDKPRAAYHTVYFSPQPPEVLGCPLGRGPTRELALADLKRRTELESPVIINWVGYTS